MRDVALRLGEGCDMKPWRDARTAREQEALAEEAVQVAGTVTGAAKLLGISRVHLTRFRRETRRLRMINKEENAVAITTAEDVARVVFDIPKTLLHRLEVAALQRKQQRGGGRMARGPIVVDAIREYLDRMERPAEPDGQQ
jgi:hypothetical protein